MMAKKKADVQPDGSYRVVQKFRDKDDYSKSYEIGDDVSHFDDERIEDLVSRGLIKSGAKEATDPESDPDTQPAA